MTMKMNRTPPAKRLEASKTARKKASKAAKHVPAEPKTHTVAAGEFKAKCLAMLDGVATGAEEIIVTKRGKPVARLVPLDWRPPWDLRGTVKYEGDIVSPDPELWDCER